MIELCEIVWWWPQKQILDTMDGIFKHALKFIKKNKNKKQEYTKGLVWIPRQTVIYLRIL